MHGDKDRRNDSHNNNNNLDNMDEMKKKKQLHFSTRARDSFRL